MKPASLLWVVVASATIGLGGIGTGVSGCVAAGDASDSVDPVAAQDELQPARHRGRHGHGLTGSADASVPETGARLTSGPSAAAVCKVCAIARTCCEAVGGGPECTFSANSCTVLGDAAARDAYANRCETFVRNIFAVWKQTPPSECL